jgi:hypothetical protein
LPPSLGTKFKPQTLRKQLQGLPNVFAQFSEFNRSGRKLAQGPASTGSTDTQKTLNFHNVRFDTTRK